MDLLAEHVVLLRDGDEVLELSFELRVTLPQQRDLPLDQRDRGAARAMRQFQTEHEPCVALEKIGVAFQVIGNRVFGEAVGQWLADDRTAVLLTHSSM